jgi:hypothetical protein
MSNNFQITKGPFAGTELDTSKLVPWRYASGQPVLIDGQQRMEWGVEYLTPIFLNVFDPTLGWSTMIDIEVMAGVTLPDHQVPLIVEGRTVTNSFGGDVPSQLQVLKVIATLTSPDGKLVHQANVLQGIINLGSADVGVKRATLQLYRAMGLPSSPDGGVLSVEREEPGAARRQDSPVTTLGSTPTRSSIRQVTAVSVARSDSEGVESEDDGVSVEQRDTEVAQSSIELTPDKSQDVQATASVQLASAPVVKVVRNSHISDRVMTQIKHFASLLGEEVKDLANDDEAKKELVRLRTASNKRM